MAMTITETDRILKMITQAENQYHKLVLTVGLSGSGKTALFNEIGKTQGWRIINLNLELSRRMLELSKPKRAYHAVHLLAEIVEQVNNSEVVLLDNTEMLFDAPLKLDPLRLLQGVSRNRTVLATWNGTVMDGQLTYAVPDHLEYRHYPTQDLLILKLEKT